MYFSLSGSEYPLASREETPRAGAIRSQADVRRAAIALESLLISRREDPAMFRRLLTSGLAALVLSVSGTAAAKDMDEPASDAMRAYDTTDALPAPAETVFGQASASAVQAAASVAHTFQGIVSYYGRELAGRKTASGERFDPRVLTMAHKTLAFGTLVRVTNLHNNRSVVVRVNDRGPFVANRVGDLSAGAAHLLGMLGAGAVHARLEVLSNAISQAFK